MKRRSLLIGAAALGMLSGQREMFGQPNPYNPSETRAEVYEDHIRIYLPLPFEHVSAPAKPFAGIYAWMFTIEEQSGLSVVLTADTAMRTSDVPTIVKHSTLRLCADVTPTSVRSCTQRLKGHATAEGAYVEIVIEDKELVKRIRVERPQNYWRYLYAPGGRFRLDRKTLVYRDRRK